MPIEEQSERLQREGWKQRSLDGFIGTAGPLWTRRADDGWRYGFLAGAHHLNPARVVHGGALLTLLDHAVSTVAWEASGRAPCVTLQLDTHFLAAVLEGQFVEARAHLEHRTSSLLFMQGALTVDGAPALNAQAIMKIVSR